MKSTALILISAILCCYLASCTGDKAGQPVPVDTSCTHNGTDTMSYANDIIPIMTTYCTDPILGDCHSPSASSGLDFTNYDLLALEIAYGNFEGRVFFPYTGDKMPSKDSSGPKDLTSCDTAKLKLWIVQDYPNN